MVNFTAVTTVLRIRTGGEDREAFSFGGSYAGDIRHSLPRHSATTFLVANCICEFLELYSSPGALLGALAAASASPGAAHTRPVKRWRHSPWCQSPCPAAAA
jgi:hypothetical protein